MSEEETFSGPPTKAVRSTRSRKAVPTTPKTMRIRKRSRVRRASRKAIESRHSAVIALSEVGVERYAVRASNVARFIQTRWPTESTLRSGKCGCPRVLGDALEHARRAHPKTDQSPFLRVTVSSDRCVIS